MSTITFRHDKNINYKLKGVKHLLKENLIDGAKGLSFMLTMKEGDTFYKIQLKETSSDNYNIKEKKNDDETTKDINSSELKKLLKSNKYLTFVKDYLESKIKYGGSTEQSIKKNSKKTTKKSTKKSLKI
jgi:hypothetical protein